MRIGIDLGGTKVEGIVLGPDGAIVERIREPTPRDDYRATVDRVVALATRLRAAAAAARPGVDPAAVPVGVGTPGSWRESARRMQNCNSTWLNGQPLHDDLRARLGPRVRIANDANCFALSEASDGAAAGASVVFGVILGTGVGAGIVVDGRVRNGANGLAGEWGHVALPDLRRPFAADAAEAAWLDGLPDRRCWCGRVNCIETFLSGPGLARTWQHAGGQGDVTQIAALATAASADGEIARAVLDLHGQLLARALAMVVNVLDPDVIVLGGGLSRLAPLYDVAGMRLRRLAFSDAAVATPVLPPRHGDASGVRGAAWLWPN